MPDASPGGRLRRATSRELVIAIFYLLRGGHARPPRSMTFHPNRLSALEIIKQSRALLRFEPLPRRTVVERTFKWLITNRRLVRDFEQRTDVAETLIRIAATTSMLRQITDARQVF